MADNPPTEETTDGAVATVDGALPEPPEEAEYREGNHDSYCGACTHFNDGICEFWNALVQADHLSNAFEQGVHPEGGDPADLPLDPEADPVATLAEGEGADLALAAVAPFNPGKHLRDPRTGKFVNTPDLLRSVDSRGAADISFIASGSPRIRGVVLSRGSSQRDVAITVGMRLGAQTGIVTFLIARRALNIDIIERLVESINVGSKLKSLTSLGVKKFSRGSYYNFYNWYSRQVGKAVPGLSEESMSHNRVELFLSDVATTDVDADGLVWKMALPVGELALSPGYNGKPVEVPLRVVEGRSDDPTYAIGLQDLVDNFNSGAVQHVTVPKSHADRVDENTGFVRKVKIGEGIVHGQKVRGLMTGVEFTEPEVKGKVERGTIANVSVGLDFGYQDKRTKKKYNAVLAHLALTNKPWVAGMQPFGVMASEDGVEADPLPENIIPLQLADPDESWDTFDTFSKRKTRIQDALDKLGDEFELIDFSDNRMLVKSAVTGTTWFAHFNDLDGSVDVYDPETWVSAEAPEETDEGLSSPTPSEEAAVPAAHEPPAEAQMTPEALAASEMSPLERAQHARRLQMSEDNRNLLKGGVHMSTKPITEMTVEELRAAYLSEQQKNAELEAATKADEHKKAVDKRITALSEQGFDAHPGFLRVVREVMLADDGGPAGVVLSEDGRARAEVTLSEAVNRIIDALPRDKDNKVLLSTQAVDTGDPKPTTVELSESPDSPEAIEARLKAAEAALAA